MPHRARTHAIACGHPGALVVSRVAAQGIAPRDGSPDSRETVSVISAGGMSATPSLPDALALAIRLAVRRRARLNAEARGNMNLVEQPGMKL